MDEQGVPIRPPATAELDVDSTDRYKTTPLSFLNYFIQTLPETGVNYTYQANQSLLTGYFTRIAVTQTQVQWQCPNINSYNDHFAYRITSNNVGFLVSDGFLGTGWHDVERITSRIVSTINGDMLIPTGNPSTFSYTISTITNNPNTQFSIIQSQNSNVKLAFLPPKYFTNQKLAVRCAKFYKTAGITIANIDPTWNGATGNPAFYKSTQLIAINTNLAYTNYFDIVSHSLNKFSRVKDSMTRQYNGQNDVLARVYLTPYNTQERFVGTAPFTFSVDYTTPKYIRWNPEEYINNFDIQLFDEYGEELYWDELYDTEFQLTISASET